MKRKSFFKSLLALVVAPSILGKIVPDKKEQEKLSGNFAMMIPEKPVYKDGLIHVADPDFFEFLKNHPMNAENKREVYWYENTDGFRKIEGYFWENKEIKEGEKI